MAHLITTTEQLRTFVPVAASFRIEEITPQIHDVEQEFIIPIIGQDQFDTLAALVGPTGTNLELLTRCRNALAKLAVWRWIPFGNVNVQSGGFSVTATDNGQVASQWRVDKLEEEMRTKGYNLLQDILTYLWSQPEGTFTDWDASDEKIEHRSTLILEANTFNKYYFIQSSYELFCRVKPGQREVMQQYIFPILGEDLYDQIMDQIQADNLSADNETLIEYIRRATAPLTIYESVASLGIDLTHGGITNLESSNNGDTTTMRVPANQNRVSYALRKAHSDGQKHLGALRAYLNNQASATKYALYYASDLYQDPALLEEEDDEDIVNDGESSVFIM